jgi:amino acid adenylation domain-containing protein
MTGLSHQDVESVRPLTSAQWELLSDTPGDEHAARHVQQDRYRVDGPLDVAALRRAWRCVVARHPALRSSIAWQRVDRPVQVVWRAARNTMRVHDLSDRDRGGRGEALATLLAEQRRDAQNLRGGPSARLALVRGDGEHELLWSCCTLLLDAWSATVVLRELLVAYAALHRGERPALPPPVPFAGYDAWRREQDRRSAEEHWRTALAGFDTPTRLRVAIPSGAPEGIGRAPLALPATLTAALRAQARRHGIDLPVLLDGAWALLLRLYSGEDEVLFGTARAGRSAAVAGIRSLIGPVATILPVRLRVEPDLPLARWLQELQRQAAEERAFEHVTLAEVQRWSEVPSSHPLFDSVVSCERLPEVSQAWPSSGLRLCAVDSFVDNGFPLTVAMDRPHGLPGELRYRRDRLDDADASQLVAHFTRVLEQLALDLGVRARELELLSRDERRRLLDLNDTTAPYDRGYCVHDLVAEQARRAPDAVAVQDDGRGLTYLELDSAAERLARRLSARGVGPEDLVATCFERGPELVVALLAVLKAGAAYVPLDPGSPRNRLRAMLRDTCARLVLTEPLLAGLLPADLDVPVLTVSGDLVDDEPVRRGGGTALRVPAVPANAAYVLYTSGSTGKPKGVVVPHGALIWLVRNAGFTSLGPRDVVALASSPAFDALTFECWAALTHGAQLSVIPRELLLSPRELGPALRRRGVTVLLVTSALLEQLAADAPDFASGLRLLAFGGQAADPAAVARVLEASGGARLVQAYGPTETTVWVAIEMVERVDAARRIPLGRPLANATVHLLDDALRPVPPGVVGEIHIGGDGLARGYLGQPARTAERFAPNPFGPGRLYRTGDLARFRTDGTLEFLGRADQQVKIRGFRVELGEVESALRAHPAVGATVVGVSDDGAAGRHLVAYVVPAGGAALPSAAELRGFLRGELPGYMVPTVYVPLDRLPLTLSGKLDRRALPLPRTSEGRLHRRTPPPVPAPLTTKPSHRGGT